jgi:hypothetical protein
VQEDEDHRRNGGNESRKVSTDGASTTAMPDCHHPGAAKVIARVKAIKIDCTLLYYLRRYSK